MVKVNLIGKRRRSSKNKSLFTWIAIGIFSIFAIYFLSATVYVIYKVYTLNNELDRVDSEQVSVSKEMLGKDKLLNDFILSKYILGKIQSLNKDKFHYKDYLDQINSILPGNVLLKNVDFSVKNLVIASVSTSDLNAFRDLEKNLTDDSILSKSVFSKVTSDGFNKEKTGNYVLKLQFEIRKK